MAVKGTCPLPRRLKEARLRSGLSQKQLGINSGMDPSVASTRVNQYERGTHLPHYAVAATLAKALRVPTAYLYTEEDRLAELVRSFPGKGERTKRIRGSLSST